MPPPANPPSKPTGKPTAKQRRKPSKKPAPEAGGALSTPPERAVTRFDLYRVCVQDPPRMARFVHAVHGGRPTVLREDFCGPASLACAWVTRSPKHRALAVDRDPEPLAFARQRMAETLGPAAAARVELICDDVRAAKLKAAARRADCVALLNFAVCELHTRAELVAYLRHLRAALRPGGVVVLDIYGGANANSPGRATTLARLDDGRRVEYTWHQQDADARTGMVRNAIHFKLGSLALKSAFTYHWRLWTIPELRDALAQAGLGRVEVHDRLGSAVDQRGELHVDPSGPDDRLTSDWVAYLVARSGGG